MKSLLVSLLTFCAFLAYSQESAYRMQGQVVDLDGNPVADAYVVNYRSHNKSITQPNGVFDMWILPKDSIFVTHVAFLRKVVTAFNLMKDPVIVLEPDTVNIKQVDVFNQRKTEMELAKENIDQIVYDPRPQVNDTYTESGRMRQLLNTENKVERAAANALTYQFSPSEIIGKIIDKMKQRKNANQYYSTRKSTKKQEPE